MIKKIARILTIRKSDELTSIEMSLECISPSSPKVRHNPPNESASAGVKKERKSQHIPPSSDCTRAEFDYDKEPGNITLICLNDGNEPIAYTAEEECQVVRLFDKHLLTLICAIYFFTQLTRTDIGNANTIGLSIDIGLTSKMYSQAIIMFYVTYILCQGVTMLYKAIKPRRFVPIAVMSSGIIAMCTCLVDSFGGIMVTRTLLGITQCFYCPGLPFYLTFFYHRTELAKKNCMFLMFAPFSAAIAGLLACAIDARPIKALTPWRMVFLTEGAPLFFIGAIALFGIVNKADEAYFLTERQKEIAHDREIRQTGIVTSEIRRPSLREAFLPLADIKAWLPAVTFLLVNISCTSLPVFLPTIIHGLGYDNIMAELLTAPPFLFSMITMYTVSRFSDRTHCRGYFAAAASLFAALGFILLATVELGAVRYLAVFLGCAGAYSCQVILFTWQGDNQASGTKKGASFILLHMIGEVGAVIGATLWPEVERPYYHRGAFICFACFLLATTAIFMNVFYIKRLNSKLFEKHCLESQDSGTADATENRSMFRYMI